MPTCPVCDKQVDADGAAFEHHVNAHFDVPAEGGAAQGGGGDQAVDDDDGIEYVGQRYVNHLNELVCSHSSAAKNSCFVCGANLDSLSEAAANAHVSDCLGKWSCDNLIGR